MPAESPRGLWETPWDDYIAPFQHRVTLDSENSMAKYMFRTSYTQSGLKGLLAEGGTGREAALRETIEGAGGSLEGFYYAFGDCDLYLIAELPDEAAATALSLNIAAAGALTVSVTVLITPETVDQAIRQSIPYRLPGA